MQRDSQQQHGSSSNNPQNANSNQRGSSGRGIGSNSQMPTSHQPSSQGNANTNTSSVHSQKKSHSVGKKVNLNSMSLLEQNMVGTSNGNNLGGNQYASNSKQINLAHQKYLSNQQQQPQSQGHSLSNSGPIAQTKKSASVKSHLNHMPANGAGPMVDMSAGLNPNQSNPNPMNSMNSMNFRANSNQHLQQNQNNNYGVVPHHFEGSNTQTISSIYQQSGSQLQFQNAQHPGPIAQQITAQQQQIAAQTMMIPVHQISSSRKGQRIQINMKNQRFQQRKASLPPNKGPQTNNGVPGQINNTAPTGVAGQQNQAQQQLQQTLPAQLQTTAGNAAPGVQLGATQSTNGVSQRYPGSSQKMAPSSDPRMINNQQVDQWDQSMSKIYQRPPSRTSGQNQPQNNNQPPMMGNGQAVQNNISNSQNGQFRSTFFHPTTYNNESLDQTSIVQLSQVYLPKDPATHHQLGGKGMKQQSQSMNRISQHQPTSQGNQAHGYSVDRLGSLTLTAPQRLTPDLSKQLKAKNKQNAVAPSNQIKGNGTRASIGAQAPGSIILNEQQQTAASHGLIQNKTMPLAMAHQFDDQQKNMRTQQFSQMCEATASSLIGHESPAKQVINNSQQIRRGKVKSVPPPQSVLVTGPNAPGQNNNHPIRTDKTPIYIPQGSNHAGVPKQHQKSISIKDRSSSQQQQQQVHMQRYIPQHAPHPTNSGLNSVKSMAMKNQPGVPPHHQNINSSGDVSKVKNNAILQQQIAQQRAHQAQQRMTPKSPVDSVMVAAQQYQQHAQEVLAQKQQQHVIYSSNNTNKSFNKNGAVIANNSGHNVNHEGNPADYTSSPSIADQTYPSISHERQENGGGNSSNARQGHKPAVGPNGGLPVAAKNQSGASQQQLINGMTKSNSQQVQQSVTGQGGRVVGRKFVINNQNSKSNQNEQNIHPDQHQQQVLQKQPSSSNSNPQNANAAQLKNRRHAQQQISRGQRGSHEASGSQRGSSSTNVQQPQQNNTNNQNTGTSGSRKNIKLSGNQNTNKLEQISKNGGKQQVNKKDPSSYQAGWDGGTGGGLKQRFVLQQQTDSSRASGGVEEQQPFNSTQQIVAKAAANQAPVQNNSNGATKVPIQGSYNLPVKLNKEAGAKKRKINRVSVQGQSSVGGDHVSTSEMDATASDSQMQQELVPHKAEKEPRKPTNFSINITQEALRRGKLATEDVAQNIAKGMYHSDGRMKKCKNSEPSPRINEMLEIKSYINDAFENNDPNQEPFETKPEYYRAGKMLGRGAFGKVNLGMHKLTRKLIAIKSINKEYLSEEKQRSKIMHEVNLLLSLRHQSVVKLYETFETSRHIMLVMELCAGGDLLNFVRKRKKLDEMTGKIIFKQVIEGIAYVHSRKVLHRDIKLDNILLDGKGNVKIADFGVSKQVQNGETMYEQSGTPAYIAPEIIRDKGYTGFKADLWSAGVVLFAMLYGTVPFKANNMKDLHQQILEAKYNLKDEISEPAKDLIRALLDTDYQTRLSIKQVLKHPWLADADMANLPGGEMFNHEEKEVIRSEFTYNDPSRYNRNEKVDDLNAQEPWDCFTELNLDSMNQTLRNASEKSVILAPFNSTMSDLQKFMDSVLKLAPMYKDKKVMMKFAARCRDQDRQYEINNNAELDNGVYHKFVYSSKDGRSEDDKEANEGDGHKHYGDGREHLLSRNSSMMGPGRHPHESSGEDLTQARPQKKKGGAQNFNAEKEALKADIRKLNRKPTGEDPHQESDYRLPDVIDEEIDEFRVRILENFGFPKDYVLMSVHENEANYCLAGYYLLGIDQNY